MKNFIQVEPGTYFIAIDPGEEKMPVIGWFLEEDGNIKDCLAISDGSIEKFVLFGFEVSVGKA